MTRIGRVGRTFADRAPPKSHVTESARDVPDSVRPLQPEVGEPSLDRHHLLAHRRGQGRPPTTLGRARCHTLEPLRALGRVHAQPRPERHVAHVRRPRERLLRQP